MPCSGAADETHTLNPPTLSLPNMHQHISDHPHAYCKQCKIEYKKQLFNKDKQQMESFLLPPPHCLQHMHAKGRTYARSHARSRTHTPLRLRVRSFVCVCSGVRACGCPCLCTHTRRGSEALCSRVVESAEDVAVGSPLSLSREMSVHAVTCGTKEQL